MAKRNYLNFVLSALLGLAVNLAQAADDGAGTPADLKKITLENGTNFELPEPSTPEEIAALSSLSPEAQLQFYKNRFLMLKPAANFFGVFGKGGQARGQKIISALNSQTLVRAPIIAKADEFGVIFSANAQGGMAFWDRGLYYADGFGLALGYDLSTKSYVIELVHDFEKLQKALPVVAQVGFGLKAMVYAANGGNKGTDTGRYFTPPLPVATNDFSGSVAFGPSMAVAFPPGIDAFYTYISKVSRLSVLKVRVSQEGKAQYRSGFRQLGQLFKEAYVQTITDIKTYRNRPYLICLNLLHD